MSWTESSLCCSPNRANQPGELRKPGLFAERGVPTRPQDLADGHCTVGYASAVTGRKAKHHGRPSNQAKEQQQDLPSLVIVNNAENYIACCKAGLGLIQIPRSTCKHRRSRARWWR